MNATPSPLFRIVVRMAAAALSIGVSGCTVVQVEERQPSAPPQTDAPAAGGHDAPAGGGHTVPMRVVVDRDAVLEAAPGEGMGVFVEYRAGGAWRVSWACDTNVTARPCPFSIRLTSAAPAFDAVDVTHAAGPSTFAADNTLDISSETTTELAYVDLSAAPGAILTVDAILEDTGEPAYVFFVQDGKVNGGFEGSLTNPLELEPSAP